MATSPGGVEVGRVTVRVLPDTSKFGAALNAKLKAIEKKIAPIKVKVDADTLGLTGPLEKVREEQEKNPLKVPVRPATDAMAAQIRAEALKISKSVQVDIPITTEGEQLRREIATQVALIEKLTKIDIPLDLEGAAELRNKMAVELDLLKSMAARANPTVDIHTEIDNASLARAESELSAASFAAHDFSGGLNGIFSAIIILGPALIPVTAAVAALGAALVAPLAIVGGGLTIFGFIAGFTIAETNKQLKAIDQLDTKLSGLTKGTKEYADTAAQLHAAQAALTPAQTAFAAALDRVKASFDSIPKAIVLKPITEGLNLLAHVLPLVEPVLRAVSGVITDIIGQFDKAARSAGFKTFIDAFAKQLGPDLRAFATIAGNVFQGLFGLFGAFNSQLSGSVLSSLENLTQKFQDWGQTVGQSKGFKSFVDYIKRVGPQVAAALAGIAAGATAIVTAFAPVGGVVLTVIGQLGQAIAKIPSDVLVALASALVALVAVSKIAGPLQALFTALATQPELVLVVAAIAALTFGFIGLYQNSKPLQHLLSDLGDFFKTKLLPVIKEAAKNILPALSNAFKDISKSIADNRPFLKAMGEVILSLGSAGVIGGILGLVAAIRIIGKAISFQIGFWHAWADVILTVLRIAVAGFTVFTKAVFAQLGLVVDAAAAAFGWIPKIGPKIKDAQAAFRQFADGVINNLDRTGDRLKRLQDQIDGHHVFKVDVNDLEAIKALEALQAFRFKDKTINVTTNMRERAVGPGGGIGQPSPNNGGAGGSSGGGASRGGDTYNIQAHDYNDFLRQQQARQRGRAGGGPSLVGSSR